MLEVAEDAHVMMAAVVEEFPLVNGGYGSNRVGVRGTISALMETKATVLDNSWLRMAGQRILFVERGGIK